MYRGMEEEVSYKEALKEYQKMHSKEKDSSLTKNGTHRHWNHEYQLGALDPINEPNDTLDRFFLIFSVI